MGQKRRAREQSRILREREIKRELEHLQRRQRSEQTEWHHFWGENAAFRARLAPAFNQALAPPLARLISSFNKPRVRILVVGGGNGAFSHNQLPAIREYLKVVGNNSRLHVVETDMDAVIRDAPLHGGRVQLDNLHLPFKADTFDLVIGQSIIHQTEMFPVIQEISRVVGKTGVFVHVQDATPDIDGKKSISIDEIKLKHRTVLAAAHLAAIENKLWFGATEVIGDVLVDRRYNLGRFQNHNWDEVNTVGYMNGYLQGHNDPAIPRGKRRIVYAGIMSVFTHRSDTPSLKKMLHLT